MVEPPFTPNETCLASDAIYQRARQIGVRLPGVDRLVTGAHRMRFVELLRRSDAAFCQAIGLPYIDTKGAHDVTSGQSPFGDFFFIDMLAGLGVTSGSVLDFGCSTGRVIRNLKAAFPAIEAYGCDPRASSIELIRDQVSEVTWFVSDEAPPLPVDHTFDTIFAISVWSHFSETRALQWFAEMRRRVSDNGRLIFTTHGKRSVYHFSSVKKSMPAERAAERLTFLAQGRVHFQRYGQTDLDSHWGMAFLPESWISSLPGWQIEGIYPGLAMANQDTYVLRVS